MKKIFTLLFLSAITAGSLSAQNSSVEKATAPKADPMEKAWMAYMTPGTMHEMLSRSVGEWSEEMTMWMTPGGEPVKNTATMKVTMIMGNRYQQGMHTGSFNGMPFEGMSIVGYDNALKKFISTWVDNMSTGIMSMEGTYDEKTRTISMSGKCVDPMTGKWMPVRETHKFVDDNTHIMEMFMQHEGKEFKSMEIKMTRKG